MKAKEARIKFGTGIVSLKPVFNRIKNEKMLRNELEKAGE